MENTRVLANGATRLHSIVIRSEREANHIGLASSDRELLDAGIHHIRDVEAVAAVQDDPVRQVELAGVGPLASGAAQVFVNDHSLARRAN